MLITNCACDTETSTGPIFPDQKSFTGHLPSYAIKYNLE